jgi:anti-anti-sigma regulatory factor
MAQVLEPEALRWRRDLPSTEHGGIVTVRPPRTVTTERDVADLRRAVRSALENGATQVVVDLSATHCLGVEAIAALLVLKAEAKRYGSCVRIDRPSRAIVRKLRTTGALGHLS